MSKACACEELKKEVAAFSHLMARIHIARCVTLNAETVRAGLDLVDKWYFICDKQSVWEEQEWQEEYDNVLKKMISF